MNEKRKTTPLISLRFRLVDTSSSLPDVSREAMENATETTSTLVQAFVR